MRHSMMTPRDSEEHRPPHSSEKAPGVYTRAENRPHNDLDMLWSGSKLYHKDDRSPLIPFLAGFILAAILTSAVFLMLNRPQDASTVNTTFVDKVIEDPFSTDEPGTATETTQAASSPSTPGSFSDASQPAKPTVSAQYSTYTVQSGDTLERIARKVYGKGTPSNIEKIQRANNLKNADSLQIDQKLVIPPVN